MTISEIIDTIIDYFFYGALGFNISCLIYYIQRCKSGIKIRKGQTVSKSQIGYRMLLKGKIQTYVVMTVSLLSLYAIICYSAGAVYFYCLSLICCYFIIQGFDNIFGNTTSFEDIEKIEHFSLYLRPFDTDYENRFHNSEKKLTIIFSKYSNVYSIGNPGIIYPRLGSASIFTSDDEWQDAVSVMMNKSQIIFVRVGNSIGSHWEIDYCFNNNLQYKTIFIVDSLQKLLELVKEWNISVDLSLYSSGIHSVFFSTKQNKWLIRQAETNKHIRALFNDFLTEHPDQLLKYKDFLEKKKYFWKYIFNSKYFPKEIHLCSEGILSNSINYVVLNNWPIYFIFSIILSYVIAQHIIFPYIWTIPYISFLALPFYFYFFFALAISFIYGPRISWLSRIWPSVEVFKNQNEKIRWLQRKYYTTYLKYYISLSLIIYFLTGKLIQIR